MPDAHYLSAAIGWLGLGNALEAHQELDRIRPQFQTHPDVMAVRCDLYAKEGKWEMAAGLVTILRDANPLDSQLWITLAYATRRKADGGLNDAKKILLEAHKFFRRESIIAYNLACYECQLGDMNSARDWLEKAFSIGDSYTLKVMALSDQDLKPLWPELKEKG